MFNTLLESRASRTKRNGSTTASALIHGALIALAVALSSTHSVDARPLAPEGPIHIVPLAPTKAPHTSRPVAPQTSNSVSQQSNVDVIIDIPTITPVGIPDIDFGRAPIEEGRIVIGRGDNPGLHTTGLVSGVGIGGVIDEAAVDRAPAVVGNAPEPRYPALLRSNGTSGHVVVRFVVDTAGRAEMDRFSVVESTHPLFADAVRNALASYRFSPGEVAGRKVRTLVQMPFAFQLR